MANYFDKYGDEVYPYEVAKATLEDFIKELKGTLRKEWQGFGDYEAGLIAGLETALDILYSLEEGREWKEVEEEGEEWEEEY